MSSLAEASCGNRIAKWILTRFGLVSDSSTVQTRFWLSQEVGSTIPRSIAFEDHRGVMKIRLSNTLKVSFTVMLLCTFLLTVGIGSLAAQDDTSQDRPFTQSYDKSSANIYYDRTRAVPRYQSRAQQDADRLVSLSPDKIISLLTEEPGLLLECKKLLARTAFEQGRVLSKEDLTDDAVFSLIRNDENVRSMFTQEISDRNYIRVKPTKGELQQDWLAGLVPLPGANGTTSLSSSASALAKSSSQEELYWLRHEDDLLRTPNPFLTPPGSGSQQFNNPGSIPTSSAPGSAPGSRAVPSMGPSQPGPMQNLPQGPANYDPRRSLMQAQSSGAFGDYFGSGGTSGLSGMGSGDLSSLISARLNMSGGTGGLGDSASGGQGSLLSRQPNMMGSFGGGMGLSSPFSGMSLGLGGGTSGSGMGNSAQLPQQASLNGGQPSPYPSYGNNQFPYSSLDIQKQPPITHRPNPYADVPSLYDLYQQYARISPTLDRFGMAVFQNGTGNFDELPMDMPVGPEYVLGPGDDLNLELTGGVSDHLRRVVDRQGILVLPDAGAVQVSGKTLGEAQQLVQNVLRSQYRGVQVDISLARVRTVRVYVVGDVEHPGPYDVSSLSTPLNAVYEAGGPTSGGSLRIFKHYRGKELVEQVDVYNLLLHGVPVGMQRLEAGDTVLVPPLGPQVTVEGMVRRPAIYEINQEKSLAEVLEIAGGVLPSGTLRHVDVERVAAHDTRSMLRLDIPENNNAADVTKLLEDFQIQDGDKVGISPILPYADKTVYLEGHVFRPGKFAYRDGMKVTDLIQSYKDLLPEPYTRHAEIIRLRKPDNTPEVLAFNLGDALSGKDQTLVLQPFDTVRVFGRFDFEDTPVVTVTGEVRDPGDHITNCLLYTSPSPRDS